MLLFLAALIGMILSIVKLVRIPRENRDERLKYKILLGACVFVLVIYAAVLGFVMWLVTNIAVNGM